MKSIRTEQFNQPLAENQEEYHTLFINLNTADPMCPATVCFEFDQSEVNEFNKTHRLYYNQCLMSKPLKNEEGEITGFVAPADQFHPMNISVYNPLEIVPIPMELIPLDQMSGDHFGQVFMKGFAPTYISTIVKRFDSLHGFHAAIASYGHFESHRKAIELGYDVEFTLSRS